MHAPRASLLGFFLRVLQLLGDLALMARGILAVGVVARLFLGPTLATGASYRHPKQKTHVTQAAANTHAHTHCAAGVRLQTAPRQRKKRL